MIETISSRTNTSTSVKPFDDALKFRESNVCIDSLLLLVVRAERIDLKVSSIVKVKIGFTPRVFRQALKITVCPIGGPGNPEGESTKAEIPCSVLG